MSDRNRSKQLEQRKQIETLISCLENNITVPQEVALAIASRLQQYMNGDLKRISHVLCSRGRSDKKKLQEYDLGWLVSNYLEMLSEKPDLAEEDIKPTEDLFCALEILSVEGIAAIDKLIDQSLVDDDAKEILSEICEELDVAREMGAIDKGIIVANRWSNSYRIYKGL